MSEGSSTGSHWPRDFMASIVVFLVALPLCLGIAIASGVPPAMGLVTGIIGGLFVAFFAGQPLQVSGPAAGLAVLVYQLVQDYGLRALGIAVLIAGVLQLVAGIMKMGRWFRAVSPPVIQGMLSGIGVLIFASQFHVMVDDKPRGAAWQNLISIPEAIYKGVVPMVGDVHHIAAAIGLLTIVSIVLWNKFRRGPVRMLPGPLVGIVLATGAAVALQLPIVRVDVPNDLWGSLQWLGVDQLEFLKEPRFWGEAVGLGLIASAETLLCATAVDRMHSGDRTDYNKELRSQGMGNILCGVVGALPMTGVIVRSSANVEAGASTKWSAILHGAWILILVVVFPQLLQLIPTAGLAAILVFTGYRLLNVPAVRGLWNRNRAEFGIWAATVFMIVATDLLTGVATGFALALLRTLAHFARLGVDVDKDGKNYAITLRGAATFMSLPRLAEALETLPSDAHVTFHLQNVAYVDQACLELVEEWAKRHPGQVTLETEELKRRNDPKQLYGTQGNPQAGSLPQEPAPGATPAS